MEDNDLEKRLRDRERRRIAIANTIYFDSIHPSLVEKGLDGKFVLIDNEGVWGISTEKRKLNRCYEEVHIEGGFEVYCPQVYQVNAKEAEEQLEREKEREEERKREKTRRARARAKEQRKYETRKETSGKKPKSEEPATHKKTAKKPPVKPKSKPRYRHTPDEDSGNYEPAGKPKQARRGRQEERAYAQKSGEDSGSVPKRTYRDKKPEGESSYTKPEERPEGALEADRNIYKDVSPTSSNKKTPEKPNKDKMTKQKQRVVDIKQIVDNFRKKFEDYMQAEHCFEVSNNGGDLQASGYYDVITSVQFGEKLKKWGLEHLLPPPTNPDGTFNRIDNVALKAMTNAWYNESRKETFDYAKGNLENIVLGASTDRLADEILPTDDPEKKYDGAVPFMPGSLPEELKGLEKVAEAHLGYFVMRKLLDDYRDAKSPAKKTETFGKIFKFGWSLLLEQLEKAKPSNDWLNAIQKYMEMNPGKLIGMVNREKSNDYNKFQKALDEVKKKPDGRELIARYYVATTPLRTNPDKFFKTLYAFTYPEKK